MSTKVVALSGVLGALASFGTHTANAVEVQGFHTLGSGSAVRSQILNSLNKNIIAEEASSSSSSGAEPTDKSGEGKCGEGKCGSTK